MILSDNAQVLQLGEVTCLFIAMHKGLGKSTHLIDESQIASVGKVRSTPKVCEYELILKQGNICIAILSDTQPGHGKVVGRSSDVATVHA
jgi:hypothetical protein